MHINIQGLNNKLDTIASDFGDIQAPIKLNVGYYCLRPEYAKKIKWI